jgi:hypothetical protein
MYMIPYVEGLKYFRETRDSWSPLIYEYHGNLLLFVAKLVSSLLHLFKLFYRISKSNLYLT